MKRTNFYLTEKQMERLHQRAEKEGVAVSELIRRAVDAFLAWDDPTYAPVPYPPQKEEPFIPISEERGFLARSGNWYASSVDRVIRSLSDYDQTSKKTD